jgi:hypothetical protein
LTSASVSVEVNSVTYVLWADQSESHPKPRNSAGNPFPATNLMRPPEFPRRTAADLRRTPDFPRHAPELFHRTPELPGHTPEPFGGAPEFLGFTPEQFYRTPELPRCAPESFRRGKTLQKPLFLTKCPLSATLSHRMGEGWGEGALTINSQLSILN